MPRAAKATPAKKSAATKAAKPAPSRAEGAQKTQKPGAAKKATPAKKTPAKKTAAVVKKAAPAKKPAAPAKKPAPVKAAAKPPVKKAPPPAKPAVKKKVVLDKFTIEQRELLLEERARHVEQAQELRAEADLIAAEMEPGDVQFDEESGEGTTTAIDRERDLALSMQAQGEVEEVDHALSKIQLGTYGACERCGQQIPKARLKAIPHARLCIACKSGGLSRR